MTEGTKASIIAGCSKRPSSKAAASEEARRTLRYVEPLSDARTLLADFFSLLGASWSTAWAADPPCDKYPIVIQTKCAAIWKSLNQEDGPTISQFGLDQLKRREEGKINAEQHLGENMAFIKQSTEKRLQRLKQRMEKE
jgi:hypothetical protein